MLLQESMLLEIAGNREFRRKQTDQWSIYKVQSKENVSNPTSLGLTKWKLIRNFESVHYLWSQWNAWNNRSMEPMTKDAMNSCKRLESKWPSNRQRVAWGVRSYSQRKGHVKISSSKHGFKSNMFFTAWDKHHRGDQQAAPKILRLKEKLKEHIRRNIKESHMISTIVLPSHSLAWIFPMRFTQLQIVPTPQPEEIGTACHYKKWKVEVSIYHWKQRQGERKQKLFQDAALHCQHAKGR